MATPTSVEEYMAALPEESRAVLEKLRKTIKAAAPEATEILEPDSPLIPDLIAWTQDRLEGQPPKPGCETVEG